MLSLYVYTSISMANCQIQICQRHRHFKYIVSLPLTNFIKAGIWRHILNTSLSSLLMHGTNKLECLSLSGLSGLVYCKLYLMGLICKLYSPSSLLTRCLRILNFFVIGSTKFKNNPILLCKISHRFLMTTKLFIYPHSCN